MTEYVTVEVKRLSGDIMLARCRKVRASLRIQRTTEASACFALCAALGWPTTFWVEAGERDGFVRFTHELPDAFGRYSDARP